MREISLPSFADFTSILPVRLLEWRIGSIGVFHFLSGQGGERVFWGVRKCFGKIWGATKIYFKICRGVRKHFCKFGGVRKYFPNYNERYESRSGIPKTYSVLTNFHGFSMSDLRFLKKFRLWRATSTFNTFSPSFRIH